MTRSAHEHAAQPEDLSRFFLERANAGDVEGLVARRQPDGTWLWVLDQPNITG